MSSVDTRVVQMQFDNKQFESGVKETMKTLGKFKESLNFAGLEKGFSVIEDACQALTDKFSVFGTISDQILRNIANKITSMGHQLLSTINQMSAGMQKYESLMGATRTMMNATGKSVEEISKVLTDLNDYTDMTSYSFSDLVSNMSSIISSGAVKDLEKAEAVMEGMANASAHAGIGIQQAAWPIQTLVKAMSSGKMGMNQWDSLRIANFITPQLIDQFIEAGKALGTLDKNGNLVKNGKKIAINAQNIRDTLRYGWLNADVMAKAFEVYANGEEGIGEAAYNAAKEAKTFTDVIDSLKDAISTGWMKSFEFLFGNVEQAAKFFTWMADAVIDVSATISEFRNELLKGWSEGGGRIAFVDTIVYIWETLVEIGGRISDAFTNVFGILESQDLLDFTTKIQESVKNMYYWLGGNANEGGDKIAPRMTLIRQAFEGLFSVLSFGWDVVKGFFGFVGNILEVLFGSSDSFLMSVGAWGRNLKSFFDGIRKNEDVPKFFENLFNTVKPFVEAVRDFATAVFNFIGSLAGLKTSEEEGATTSNKFMEALTWLKDGAKSVLGFLTKTFSKLTAWFNFFSKAKDSKDLASRFKLFWKLTTEEFKAGIDAFKEKASKWLELMKLRFSLWISKFKYFIWPKIKKWFSETVAKIGEWLAETWPKIKSWFAETATKIGDWFAETWPKVKTAVSEWFTSFADSLPETWKKAKGKVEEFFGNIGKWFRDTFGSLFTKKNGETSLVEDAVNTGKTVVETLSEIDAKDAEGAKGSIGFFEFVKEIINTVGAIIVSIFHIIDNVFGFVETTTKWIAQNPFITIIFAIVALIASIASSLKSIKKLAMPKKETFSAKVMEFAKAIMAMAGAIAILAIISKWTSIWSAVGAIITMFVAVIGVSVALQAFNQAMKKKNKKFEFENVTRRIKSIGYGLLGLSLSIAVMARVIAYFASMSPETFWKGSWKLAILLSGMALIYGVLKWAVSKFKKSRDLASSNNWKAILAISAGIIAMVGAFAIMLNVIKGADPLAVIGALATVSLMVIALGKAAQIAGNSGMKHGLGTFLGLAAAVVAISALLELCKSAPWYVTAIVFAGLLGVIWGLSLVLEASKGINKTSIAGLMVVFLGFAAVVIAIRYALAYAASTPFEILAVFLAGLIGIILSLALVLQVVKNANITKESIIAIAVIMVSFAVIAFATAGALNLIPKDMQWETIIAFCFGMIIVVASVAALCLIVNETAKIVEKTSLVTMLKAVLVVAVVGILALALTLLATLLSEIAFDSIKNAMTSLSETMFILGTGIKDWADLTKDIDFIQEGTNILEFVLRFAAASVVLSSRVDFDAFNAFRTNVFTLGVAIKGLNDRLSDVNRETLQEKLNVIEDIAEAAKKLNEAPNVGNMSETITNIGGAIKLYFESLNGVDMVPKDSEGNPIDTSQIDSQGFIQMFRSIAGQMPDEEDLKAVGLYSDNSTGTTLGQFAVGITNLSTALTTFSKEMANANQTAIETGITKLQQFAAIQQALPEETTFSSLFTFFSGKKESLGEFGADIEAVGGALTSFATNIGGALSVVGKDAKGNDITNMDKAIEAAERMKDLGNALPTRTNALFSWFGGKQMSLGEFGSNMSTLGEGINKFVTKVFADGVTYTGDQMDGIIDVVDAFVEIQNKIVKKESGNALDKFALYLGQAGEGIRTFNETAMFDESGNAVNYDSDKLKTLAEIVDIFVEIQNSIKKKDPGNAISNFAGYLKDSSNDFRTFFESASTWTVDTEKLKAMGETASGIAQAFGRGFGDSSSEAIESYSNEKIVASIRGVISGISNMFKPKGEFYESMVACGQYLDLGLEAGIKNYADRPINAIANVGYRMETRIRDITMVNSPSKLFHDIGMWIDIGMERGIIDYSGKPIEAAEFMAYGIEEAVRDATTVHSDPPLYNGIGWWMPTGIGNGIESAFPGLLETVNNKMTQLKDTVSNGWDNVMGVFNGTQTVEDALLNTFNFDKKTVNGVINAFKEKNYAEVIAQLTGLGFDDYNIATLFGIDSHDFLEGTSLGDMFKFKFGQSHDTSPIEADTVKVDKVDTLGTDASNSTISGKGGRGSSESSNLGKQTTTVSSGGLNISMTDGYTIGDILNRIDRLETAITNMRIVMDSGVLAGQVASGVDRELGNYATLNGRWN